MKPWGAALVDPVPMRTTRAHAAIRYLRDADMSRCKKTGRDRLSPIPPRFKHQTLRERQLICSTSVRGGKQLPCARVDGQSCDGDNRQARCRHRPTIRRIRASEPDYAEVSRRVQIARDIVERDSINRLIADRYASAFEVHPSRAPRTAVSGGIIRHQEDMAGMRVSEGCSDELVVAQVRHIRTI